MKPVVLKKDFADDIDRQYKIGRCYGDEDKYVLEYHDKDLDIAILISAGGVTDGGSIPAVARGIISPMLGKTIHGYVFHDELWSHRVVYKDLYDRIGLTFRETNRIMFDLHRLAGVSYAKAITIKKAVDWFGFIKWYTPDKYAKGKYPPTMEIKIMREQNDK